MSSTHILIVDDDVAYGEQLQRSLTRRNCTVDLAHDAASALAVATARVPDAALLDLKLAEDSGMRLIEPLRALSANMVIVLLTGYASVATAVEAIKRGADDYLPKPAGIESILRALNGDGSSGDYEEPPETMTPLKRLEWEHIQQALNASGGNISAAARLLGMHRRSLQRKLGKRPVPGRGHGVFPARGGNRPRAGLPGLRGKGDGRRGAGGQGRLRALTCDLEGSCQVRFP